MTAEMAMMRMDDPTKFPICTNFVCWICFKNNENRDDETSFDVDCTQKYWRDELLSCWEDFRKENNLPEDCVTDASLLSYKTCYAKQCYDYRCCGLEIKDNDNDEEIKMNDPVNHPSHYTDGSIEVIDYIEDKNLGYHLGNAIKYISRAGKKNKDKTIEDLQKAVWYINRYIELISKK